MTIQKLKNAYRRYLNRFRFWERLARLVGKDKIMMKLTILLISFLIAIPGYSAAGKLSNLSAIGKDINKIETRLTNTETEITDIKTDKKVSNKAQVISGCLGMWGLLTFSSTGLLYPLVTGSIFIYAAFRD